MQLEDYFDFLGPDDIRIKGTRVGSAPYTVIRSRSCLPIVYGDSVNRPQQRILSHRFQF